MAAGNVPDLAARPELVAALASALAGGHPLVRGHAAWALGRAGGSLARQALAAARAREREPWIVEEVVVASRSMEDLE